MKPEYKPIVAALIFSAVLMGSEYFLKNNSARVWVNLAASISGAYFWFWYFMISDRKCTSPNNRGGDDMHARL
jgi:hypothetical protein